VQRIDTIELAFFKVKASSEKFMADGDAAHKELSFQGIFALNNEIGKLGRESPKTMPKMKELQAYVNMITVGLKYDKQDGLQEGLAATEKAIRALREDSSAMP
jgi:hypothetical protein